MHLALNLALNLTENYLMSHVIDELTFQLLQITQIASVLLFAIAIHLPELVHYFQVMRLIA